MISPVIFRQGGMVRGTAALDAGFALGWPLRPEANALSDLLLLLSWLTCSYRPGRSWTDHRVRWCPSSLLLI